MLVVRTTGEPDATARRLRALVAAVDADVPVSHVRRLDAPLADSLARPRGWPAPWC